MTYQEKMAAAVAKAEVWQAEVDKYETEAEAQAIKNIKAKRKPKFRDLPVALGPVLLVHIKEVLDEDHMYKRAVANRNAQQTLAQMYGTAALVAAKYGMEG